jgi:ADP-heptose:LPS heptosyltransferase
VPDREAILLVRLDGVGDAALCVPALEGLARAFPHASFGAVCSAANASLFSQRVERIHIYDAKEPAAARREELRSARYTRALVATEEVEGYQLARVSGAPLRAGFWHRFHKPFKSLWQRGQLTSAVYRPAAWTEQPEHEVTMLYRLAAALGAQASAPADHATLRTWLRIESSTEGRAAAGATGFQISPKLFTAHWGPSGLAQAIAEAITGSECKRCLLIAASLDEGLACSIMEHIPVRVRSSGNVTVVSSMSLPHWLDVLDSLDVLVTPDTGAAHVAGMLGVRVIDLFDEADFDRISRQWRPWAGPSRCIAKPRWEEGRATSLGRQISSAMRDLRATEAVRSALPAEAT